MKKKIAALFLALILLFPAQTMVNASQKKIYGSKGELYAFTREAITLYTDQYGSSSEGSVPRHKGMKVIETSGAYYEVEFKKKGRLISGCISREDYNDLCLKYDGSEIFYVADGTYSLGGQKIVIENLGGNECQIYVKDSGKYFTASKAGVLLLQDKKQNKKKEPSSDQIFKMDRIDHHLVIMNKQTKTYLVPSGSLIGMGSKKEAKESSWVLIREDANLAPYRDFLQYDGRWGGKKYGDSSPYCSGGCGVVAVVNMIYALTGQFAEVEEVGDYAVLTHYRVPDNGTDEGFSKAFVKGRGEFYGLKYAGKAPGVRAVKKCLQAGGACVAHVPGHYVAIVAYNEKKDKFLVLDPHPLPKRKTSPYGSWVSRERLEAGYLNCYSSYKFERLTETDFSWDIDKQDSAIVKKAVIKVKISLTEQTIKDWIAKGLNRHEKME